MTELNRNESITVGTDAVVVSSEKGVANAMRSNISIINTSAGGQVVTVAIGAEATAGAGIVLNPGGSWQDSRDGQYMPTQKHITAIASAAGGVIAIQERLI